MLPTYHSHYHSLMVRTCVIVSFFIASPTHTDAASSRIFSYLTPKLLTQLSSQSITFNSHSWGVATEMFQSSHLHTFFKMLSTNKDRNGVDFVSTIECKS